MKRLFFCALAAAFALCACNGSGIDWTDLGGSDSGNEYKALELSTKGAGYVEKGNGFALRLMENVIGAESINGGSFIVSPLSMQFLLGMMLSGAQGQTADEICEVLGYGASETADVNEYCKSLLAQLPGLDAKTKLKIANAVLVNKNYSMLDSYKKTVADFYGAKVENTEFNMAAVNRINSWCSQQTAGKIPSILKALDPDTFAVLLNAMYFKSKWSNEFSKDATAKTIFIREDGTNKYVDMMKQGGMRSYGWHDIFRAVSLPYGNGAFSMVICLPDEGHTVSEVAAALNDIGWKSFLNGMGSCKVDLWLPKFESTTELKFNDLLSAMGMPLAFTALADFGAMTELPVCISEIKQKAFISVDESGSEAAAVSIGTMMPTSAGPEPGETVVFHCDHPFLYFITEQSSSAILFAGNYQ